MSLARALQRLQDTTAQIRVRGAFALLIGFAALAEKVGLETILGAFAAGALLSLIDRDEAMTHPQFRLKLGAVGFGVFIPVFFVASGLWFDLNALFATPSTVARVPLFLLAIVLARARAAVVYVQLLGRSRAMIAGILQATSLPFTVAATQIGLQLGVVTRASAAGLVAAGLLSVVICPALGLILLRRRRAEGERPTQFAEPHDAGANRRGSRALPRRRGIGTVTPVRTIKVVSVAAAAGLALGGCGSSGHSSKSTATTTAPARNDQPVAPRPTAIAVRVTRTAYGPALSDRRGFALYRFTHDSSVTSTCYGPCAGRWPPYVVSKHPSAAGPGAHAGLLGSVRRRDGRLQVTYAGHPLYYYVGDSRRGEVLCQAATEFGGTWYVVAADGRVIH